MARQFSGGGACLAGPDSENRFGKLDGHPPPSGLFRGCCPIKPNKIGYQLPRGALHMLAQTLYIQP